MTRPSYGTFIVVLAAILVAHSTVEADDNGPDPIPHSEDSPAGGPFEKAMDEKSAHVRGVKKELDAQGGEEGIQHGGKLVKSWLKTADNRYRARSPTEKQDDEDEVQDDPDKSEEEDDAAGTKDNKDAGEKVVEEEEEEKALETKAVSDANEKVEQMEKKVQDVEEEAAKEKKEAQEEMTKAKEEEAHAGDDTKQAAKQAAKMAYTAEEHRAEVAKQGQAEAKIQVTKAEKIIADAKEKAAAIIKAAKGKAAEISSSAHTAANTMANQASEKVNEKAHALLAKAKQVEQQATQDGEKARDAALKAVKAKAESEKRAENAKAQLDKAKIVKTFARAKAAEQNEVAQKKAASGAKYKAEATKMVQDLKVSQDALKQEVQKEQAREAADRTMAMKLKGTEQEAENDRQRARTMIEKSEKAKTQIQVAAKDAIRKAVKNAAILASVEKKKVDKAASKERATKDLGSANVLAARAQTNAEERLAKDDIQKAKVEMNKVREAKEKALAQVKMAASSHADAGQVLKSENAKDSKALATDEAKISTLKQDLAEANSDTAGETLLTAMYQALPYEDSCGSLSDDPAKIRTVAASDKGGCAAHCASLSACKSFQFNAKSCVLSKKVILTNSKYGEMLACATKNVLIKPNMKATKDTATTFQKKMKDEMLMEDEVLLDLGETYGFEMPDETQDVKTDTKVKAQNGPNKDKSDSPTDEGTVVQDATAKKWATKLKSAKEALQACNVANTKATSELAKLKAGAGGDSAKEKKLAGQVSDLNAKLGAEDSNKQLAIKTAVDAAKADEEKKKQGELKAQADAFKKNQTATVKNIEAKDSKVADAKMVKGKKAEAIAKEALKKAMTLSDAEKEEMAQNKKLAAELGKEKTKLLVAKKEKQAFQGELKEAKIVDGARLKKQKNKVEQLESKEIEDSAGKAEAQEEETDEKGVQKQLVASAQAMAIGMSVKNKEIKQLKKTIEKHLGKHKANKKEIRKLIKDQKKAKIQLTNCQKTGAKKLRNAKHKYRSSVDKLRDTIQTHLTQAELAKRALQLCEGKERGSVGRAANRVARRENRAVKRAKRKMGEKGAEKNLEKELKVKLEAKITTKYKKKFEKSVADKVASLTKKKVSPKCKACLKLEDGERKLLGADCKACA